MEIMRTDLGLGRMLERATLDGSDYSSDDIDRGPDAELTQAANGRALREWLLGLNEHFTVDPTPIPKPERPDYGPPSIGFVIERRGLGGA